MNNNYNKFLPLGTVVLLKNAKKRLMITGFCFSEPQDKDKVYDYSGCLYPEGIISSNQTALFNHEQIDKVYYLGYRDQEEIDFQKKLNTIVEINSSINSNGVNINSANVQ